jgi:unsaturated pyranuronate lyase
MVKRSSANPVPDILSSSGGFMSKDATAAKKQPTYHRWSEIALEPLNPKLDRQFIVGEQMMLARVLLKKGCVVPMHQHENEQITYILEGALHFKIGGEEVTVRAGEVLCIPPNVPHQAEALEDTVDLDVFNPPRQDWIDKSDAYLRK